MTHFPIALVFVALLLDAAAFFVRSPGLRRDLGAAGFYAVILAALGGLGGVITGLGLCHWRFFGEGLLGSHHLFVWPGFGLLIIGAVWRIFMKPGTSGKGMAAYLCLMTLAAVAMGLSGYYGGEMVHS